MTKAKSLLDCLTCAARGTFLAETDFESAWNVLCTLAYVFIQFNAAFGDNGSMSGLAGGTLF